MFVFNGQPPKCQCKPAFFSLFFPLLPDHDFLPRLPCVLLLVHHQRPRKHFDPVPKKLHRNRPRQIERVLLQHFPKWQVRCRFAEFYHLGQIRPCCWSVRETQALRYLQSRLRNLQPGPPRPVGHKGDLPRPLCRPQVFNPRKGRDVKHGRQNRRHRQMPEQAVGARRNGGRVAQIFTLNSSPALSESAKAQISRGICSRSRKLIISTGECM